MELIWLLHYSLINFLWPCRRAMMREINRRARPFKDTASRGSCPLFEPTPTFIRLTVTALTFRRLNARPRFPGGVTPRLKIAPAPAVGGVRPCRCAPAHVRERSAGGLRVDHHAYLLPPSSPSATSRQRAQSRSPGNRPARCAPGDRNHVSDQWASFPTNRLADFANEPRPLLRSYCNTV